MKTQLYSRFCVKHSASLKRWARGGCSFCYKGEASPKPSSLSRFGEVPTFVAQVLKSTSRSFGEAQRCALLILCSLFFLFHASPIWSQDTLRYSQENGILEKQRFIDRYDYVFMTKEPTKWMLRVGGASSIARGGLNATFEYKISPSFSVLAGGSFSSYSSLSGLIGNVYGGTRYYYDMKKRMEEGKNANNFTGNYFGIMGLYYLNRRSRRDYFPSEWGRWSNVENSIELQWGMQRRFFNRGFADFGLSLGGRKIAENDFSGSWSNEDIRNELFIESFWSVGLAFGDFKKKKLPPLCDVLKCYETNRSLWKIAWPNFFVGQRFQIASTSLAYERQIARSDFSINLQNNFLVRNQSILSSSNPTQPMLDGENLYLLSTSYLQARYYWGKRSRKERLEGSPSLTGGYLGMALLHIYEGNSNDSGGNKRYINRYNGVEIGPSIGYQQKLFSRGYLDFGLTIGKTIFRFDDFGPASGTYGFRSSFKIGFAF
ncbi:MAG: hypothetical protein ACK4GN_00605 [Runella sp.]